MSELDETREIAHTNGDASHLAWLRKRHDELSEDRTLDLPVPGYDDRLVLRCGPVPWATIARVQNLVGRREDRDGRALLAAQADTIIAACRDVLLRHTDGGELEAIDPSGPRRIDPELATLLGSGTTSARATLLWLFPSEVGLSIAAGQLLDWTRTMQSDVADELVGE